MNNNLRMYVLHMYICMCFSHYNLHTAVVSCSLYTIHTVHSNSNSNTSSKYNVIIRLITLRLRMI